MSRRNQQSAQKPDLKIPDLVIESWGGRQFQIDSVLGTHADFDRENVSFGGFFGEHGPNVYAAAPQLLAAVKDLLGPLELAAAILKSEGRRLDKNAQASFDKARAAIDLAETPAPSATNSRRSYLDRVSA